jgi:hypothetical protein
MLLQIGIMTVAFLVLTVAGRNVLVCLLSSRFLFVVLPKAVAAKKSGQI